MEIFRVTTSCDSSCCKKGIFDNCSIWEDREQLRRNKGCQVQSNLLMNKLDTNICKRTGVWSGPTASVVNLHEIWLQCGSLWQEWHWACDLSLEWSFVMLCADMKHPVVKSVKQVSHLSRPDTKSVKTWMSGQHKLKIWRMHVDARHDTSFPLTWWGFSSNKNVQEKCSKKDPNWQSKMGHFVSHQQSMVSNWCHCKTNWCHPSGRHWWKCTHCVTGAAREQEQTVWHFVGV